MEGGCRAQNWLPGFLDRFFMAKIKMFPNILK
jgi:hypothetical protein